MLIELSWSVYTLTPSTYTFMADTALAMRAVAETTTSVPTVELLVGLQMFTDGIVEPAGHCANVVAENAKNNSGTKSKALQGRIQMLRGETLPIHLHDSCRSALYNR
jgi:hypothetical protein